MYRQPSDSPPSVSRQSPPVSEGRNSDQILIGQRLLKTGLLSQSQIAQALREKKQKHLKVGEVCLEHGWISPAKLYSLLPSTDLGIGELLILRGVLTFEQLQTALAAQRNSDWKLGQILQAQGWVDDRTLTEVLRQQSHIRRLPYLDAWQALQVAQTKSSSHPAVPRYPNTDPIDGDRDPTISPATQGVAHPKTQPDLETSDSQIEQARSGTRQTSLPETPVAETRYRSRIADLELQLDMQQREWQVVTDQMNQQVAEFQSQYQARIAQLERQLHQQQQLQEPIHHQLQTYQDRIQQLELEVASFRALHQQDQAQVQSLQTQIRYLEQELHHAQDDQQWEQADLHQHYQRQLQNTEAAMLEQQQLAEERQADLHFRLHRAKECIETLTHQLAETQTTYQQSLQEAEDRVQHLTQALVQAQADPLPASGSPSGDLQTTVDRLTHPICPGEQQIQGEDAHELVTAYRQSLKSLQQQLQAQRTQNRWLAARLIHLQEASGHLDPDPIGLTNDGSAPTGSPPEHLLTRLQGAELITESQRQEILALWSQRGGELTPILTQQTDLSEVTIAYFQAEDPSDLSNDPDPSTFRCLSDRLIAADLVTEADLQKIRDLYPSLPAAQLGEALAEQGVIRPGTARYFINTQPCSGAVL